MFLKKTPPHFPLISSTNTQKTYHSIGGLGLELKFALVREILCEQVYRGK